jgi:hypothetical protein
MRCVFVLFLAATAFAADAAPIPADLPAIVAREFGPDFEIATTRTKSTVRYAKPANDRWTPFLITDLDDDGQEDAVIVARSKSPMTRADEVHYKVVDPYFAHHGYGDPKITANLTTENPDQGHVVLVVHSWKAATPKAKFAIVNLPFENLGLTRVKHRRKVLPALALEMRDLPASIAFFDGKKWRWRDGQL